MRLKRFLPALFLLVCLAPSSWVFADKGETPAERVIVLGIDGMDPKLLQQYVDEGVLPNFKKLIDQGDFKPLKSSMPPLSPTAWSDFITGMSPGGHGIFDFVHRDPKTRAPFMSMSRAIPPGRTFTLGSYQFPLTGGGVEQLRQGRAFWQVLDDHDIYSIIYKMPVNFPPVESKGVAISGMGTPDITGSPGSFSFFTTKLPRNVKDITGGECYEVDVNNGRVDAKLIGPANSFRLVPKKGSPRRNPDGTEAEPDYENPLCEIPFTVFVDPKDDVVKIVVQDEEFVLQVGEWSKWISMDFEALKPLVSINAVGQFYLQEVRPEFKLFVTPLQISVENPALPITQPAEWAKELYDNLGNFYTAQLPENTKALSGGIFTCDEFWRQARRVFDENRKALDFHLEKFDKGLLFFYFGSVDQGCHMLWRYVDKNHPGYIETPGMEDSIKRLYIEMDEVIERTMKEVGEDTTLIVMSDHGFSPFYWGVNLNTWLQQKDYIAFKSTYKPESFRYFENVDWSGTKAYAVGLNGLYVNLEGRESGGIVPQADYEKVLDELEKDLLELRDPRNGNQAVTLVVRTRRDMPGAAVGIGPDILVGYNYGYRTSWESPLGEFPAEVFVDNKEAWSGDHCIDNSKVPGVLITNKKITLDAPALTDLTVGVLDEFGVPKLKEMIGQDCIGPRK